MAEDKEDLFQRIKHHVQGQDFHRRAEREAPITFLTPEAREEAQKVAKE